MKVHGGADIHPAAHGGPHNGASGCALKKAVAPWRTCIGEESGSTRGPVEREAHTGAVNVKEELGNSDSSTQVN
ncbi:hypothetical protein llap_2566 [Limosa lapponica baueri]|uniref:Uncharacterized protein n=1 Tax=Limosa lapponica baueri TaxID=1758121 RepID=A0A2I0UM49_LIMLA|nr:hypothetical protein llap_2566 [Limosa lapponica baueri]